MFINGLPTYSKEGKKLQTGLILGRAAKDGQIYATQSGKEVGSVSVPAYDKQDGTTAWLTVKGWGHGAGMRQDGAAFLANQGASYQEILEHYYPGALLEGAA